MYLIAVPRSTRNGRGLGPDGEVHGTVHLQVPALRARGPLLLADGAAAQHAGEPRVHGRDHVRVLQHSWTVHRCTG